MLPKILPKNRFKEFVESLMAANRVFAPVAKGRNFAFAALDGPEDVELIRMDYDITILPPKKAIQPQQDTLLEFSGPTPDSAKARLSTPATVILGAHPYDLHGIATLDAAFAGAPQDPYYLARRAATKIIGLNINAGYADEHQFMADMNTLEPPQGSFDLFMTDLGNRYYVEVGSEAGSEMAKADIFRPAGAEDHKAKQHFELKKAANYHKRLPYDARYLPDMLDRNYDSLLWDAHARRCFSCGTCTNVCPTCYCFDVQDKLNIDAASGTRQRRWDSCQLKSFAEVAGGENFREHRSSRLRHRVYRKGKFILERTGKMGCVGCGRCIRHCVANISILEAFQQIADQTEPQA